jgi:hypothetical protein
MTHHHLLRRCTAGAATVAAALALGACGGSGSGAGDPVTVTVTPTVGGDRSSSSTTTSAAPKRPSSDVVGRRYDYGTVTEVSKVATTTVVELDRWTWKGLDDAKLAQQGVPTGPFKGKVPYTNQNTRTTFTIPVVDGARVLYNHCVAFDQPLQTKSVTVEDLAHLADREQTVLVQLDDQGRLTSAQNIPGCPG